MSRNKVEQSTTTENEPSLPELWDAAEPGTTPFAKGVYALFKLPDDSMLLVLRPDGAGEDHHLPIPPMLLKMAFNAMEGKGPLGHVRGMAERHAARFGG